LEKAIGEEPYARDGIIKRILAFRFSVFFFSSFQKKGQRKMKLDRHDYWMIF